MNAASQWTTIGWMVACGMLMGIAFDFYRVFSHRFHIPRWLLPPLDIAFWAAATLGVFSVLLKHNHGEVRMYVFLGLGIGVTGYFGMFSSYVVRIFDWLQNAFIGLLKLIWKMFHLLLFTPFFGIVRLLAKLLDIAFVVTAAIVLWTVRLLYMPLRPLIRWLWRKLLPLRNRMKRWLDMLLRIRNRIKAAWDYFRKKI